MTAGRKALEREVQSLRVRLRKAEEREQVELHLDLARVDLLVSLAELALGIDGERGANRLKEGP